MASSSLRRLVRGLWRTFLGGLLVIVPAGVTFYVLWLFYRLVDGVVGRTTPFGETVVKLFGRWIPGMGILLTIALVLVVGLVARNVLGRALQDYVEKAFFFVPGVGRMYSTVKQITHAVFNRDAPAFQKVVTFEYTKEGLRVIGLVSNEDLGKLQDETGEERVMVYLPKAPNPLSGTMLIIPKKKLTYLDMPVEDALSLILSSGSVLPPSLRKEEKAEVSRELGPNEPARK
jgi:uncharacterized membrane protein